MVSIGAQWAALQAVAWVTMAVSYTVDSGSVVEGLSKTFDGVHPCKLCGVVKQGSESQKKDPKQEAAKKKVELFRDCEVLILSQLSPSAQEPCALDVFGETRAIPPALGPPRGVEI